MNETKRPALTLCSPPRYGRRAVWSLLIALALVGMAFCIDEAASNQLASSDMPTLWALYLAAVALYYALICAFRWFRKKPPCQSAADIL